MDKYIVLTLNYYYNEKGITQVSINELKNFINETFNKSYTTENIIKKGLTPYMIDNRVNIDFENNIYSIDNDVTLLHIANKKLNKYIHLNTKKKSDSKFIVTYQKYTVTNPYEVLNYYENNSDNQYDTTKIKEYLQGKGKEKNLLDAVTKSNVSKLAKKSNIIIITYEFKDNGLVITRVEAKKNK